MRNIPDNKRTIDIKIELWDDDGFEGEGSSDDIMDLNPRTNLSKTLELKYDIVEQSWSGVDSGKYGGGISTIDGTGDGLDERIEEKDGEIKYTMKTEGGIRPDRKETLAQKYSPVLYFNKSENYYPRDIRDYLEQTDLKDGDDNTIDSSPTREDLSRHTGSDNYLDWNGDKDIDYGYNIYSHVFKAMNDKIVIQYWFFYLNNPGTEHLTAHEGDWEMIQIVVDEYENPHKAGYSQHYGGAKRDWSDVNKVEGTHPEVYVSKDGHASYFESGTTGSPVSDEHQGEGKKLDPSDYTIDQISNQDWLNFKGDWGEDGGSVPAAPFRHTKGNLGELGDSNWGASKSYPWIEPNYWHSVIGD